MVRAPCCEKMGVKRGPWKPEEDEILISYIHKHGHGNWRALPKQAGLLRCGKSCRLRWTNYLRPDIKRGNFTKEEEETIIKLHAKLGNRWSTIAAKLPGRTDNEIKNVWHTNLKKQVKDYEPPPPNTKSKRGSKLGKATEPLTSTISNCTTTTTPTQEESSSEISSLTAENKHTSEYVPQIDESFWLEERLTSEIVIKHEKIESNEMPTDYSVTSTSHNTNNVCASKVEEDMDFWFNLFIKSGDIPEFP